MRVARLCFSRLICLFSRRRQPKLSVLIVVGQHWYSENNLIICVCVQYSNLHVFCNKSNLIFIYCYIAISNHYSKNSSVSSESKVHSRFWKHFSRNATFIYIDLPCCNVTLMLGKNVFLHVDTWLIRQSLMQQGISLCSSSTYLEAKCQTGPEAGWFGMSLILCPWPWTVADPRFVLSVQCAAIPLNP